MRRSRIKHCPYSSWSRRDLLLSASAVFAGTAADARAAATAPTAPVAVARCPSYRRAEVPPAISGLLDQLGGVGGLVRGKTVTVKLNMTGSPASKFQGRPLGSSHYCHPTVVGAVLKQLDDAGAARIKVVEGGFGGSGRLEEYMLDSGWSVRSLKGAAAKVEFYNSNALGGLDSYARIATPGGGHMFRSFLVHPAYVETDVFVTIAKLKNHATCGVTLSLKNSFGITPASIYGGDAGIDEPNESPTKGRSPFHDGSRQPSKIADAENDPSSPRASGYRVPRIVADLVAARPIDLQIIDGVETMVGGEGPWVGEDDLRMGAPGLIIAGLNPVCTDAVATAVMGYDPRDEKGSIPFRNCDNHLLLAEKHGVGTADLSRIDVRGLSIAEALYPFEPAPAAGRAGRGA